MNETGENAFKQSATNQTVARITIADRIVGLVVGLLFIGLCTGIWLKPDLISGNVDKLGGPAIASALDLVWSRPVAIISGIIGLFVAWGSITRKTGAGPRR